MRVTFVEAEYAPPPPAAQKVAEAPPPITSILFLLLFQSLGTVYACSPGVRIKICFCGVGTATSSRDFGVDVPIPKLPEFRTVTRFAEVELNKLKTGTAV